MGLFSWKIYKAIQSCRKWYNLLIWVWVLGKEKYAMITKPVCHLSSPVHSIWDQVICKYSLGVNTFEPIAFVLMSWQFCNSRRLPIACDKSRVTVYPYFLETESFILDSAVKYIDSTELFGKCKEIFKWHTWYYRRKIVPC